MEYGTQRKLEHEILMQKSFMNLFDLSSIATDTKEAIDWKNLEHKYDIEIFAQKLFFNRVMMY